jgi:hypothetical protein
MTLSKDVFIFRFRTKWTRFVPEAEQPDYEKWLSENEGGRNWLTASAIKRAFPTSFFILTEGYSSPIATVSGGWMAGSRPASGTWICLRSRNVPTGVMSAIRPMRNHITSG